MRAAGPRPLWLPPVVISTRAVPVERKPGAPVITQQGPIGQKAAVTFGNLADIGKALRASRKARREELERPAEALQPPMFEL